MRIDVLYFASLREAVGTARECIEIVGTPTAGTLLDVLRARGGAWANALGADRPLRVAVDKTVAKLDTPLRDGAEVAIFPPVTGG